MRKSQCYEIQITLREPKYDQFPAGVRTSIGTIFKRHFSIFSIVFLSLNKTIGT